VEKFGFSGTLRMRKARWSFTRP